MMIKIANSLIALGCAALLLSLSSPSLAKAKSKVSHRAKPPSYQSYVRAPVLVAPVVRCLHGVWDPYGVRCDDPVGSR
jgi:hypothetical protein